MIFVLLSALVLIIMMGGFAKANAEPEYTCPPHEWRYHDQPGMEGVVYLKCEKCKSSPSYVMENR
jgi:hypothetical protein